MFYLIKLTTPNGTIEYYKDECPVYVGTTVSIERAKRLTARQAIKTINLLREDLDGYAAITRIYDTRKDNR